MGAPLWARVEVRGNVAPGIRRSGRFAWQAFEALVRIAKEEKSDGFIPDDRAEGFEIAFWCNLPEFERELESARDRLVDNGLIERVEGGFRFANWRKYQESDPTNADRQARHRAKKRRKAAEDSAASPGDESNGSNALPVTGNKDPVSNGSNGYHTTPHQTTETPPNPPVGGGCVPDPFGGTEPDPDAYDPLPGSRIPDVVTEAFNSSRFSPRPSPLPKAADALYGVYADAIKRNGSSPPPRAESLPYLARLIVFCFRLSDDERNGDEPLAFARKMALRSAERDWWTDRNQDKSGSMGWLWGTKHDPSRQLAALRQKVLASSGPTQRERRPYDGPSHQWSDAIPAPDDSQDELGDPIREGTPVLTHPDGRWRILGKPYPTTLVGEPNPRFLRAVS